MRIPFDVPTVDGQHSVVRRTFVTQPNAVCLTSGIRLHRTSASFSHAAFAFRCKRGFKYKTFTKLYFVQFVYKNIVNKEHPYFIFTSTLLHNVSKISLQYCGFKMKMQKDLNEDQLNQLSYQYDKIAEECFLTCVGITTNSFLPFLYLVK